MKTTYLSKSDFKAAYDCASKLRYRKARFPTNLDENDYIQFLADGGFMVELLAKAKFPGGHDLVDDRDQPRAFARTAELLRSNPDAVIYEAAALHDRILARVDILRREGDTLHLIEVKSSSVGGEEEPDDSQEEFVLTRGPNQGEPNAKWLPYLLDITFQRMVLQLAFPAFKRVKASLCVVNKSATARDCETLRLFKLTPQKSDDPERPRARPRVEYLGDPKDLRTSELMVLRDVTSLTDQLMDRVRVRAHELAALLQPDGQAAAVPPSLPDVYKLCKKCEYRLKGESAQKAERDGRHGFQQCWGARAATPYHLLDLSRVTQIVAPGERGPVEALIARGGSSFLQLGADDLGAAGPRRDRRFVQWDNSRGPGREHLPASLSQELLTHRRHPGGPLHFLDFEACNVALPHHAGLRPYERVAFQFSCHTLSGAEDGRAPLPATCHRAWLNTDCAFPNFKFARALRECLGESGTVYVWSHFEQSTLAVVLRQLRASLQQDPTATVGLAGAASLEEVNSLADWLERLLGPEELGANKKLKRVSPRIRDLHDLCLKHYFHPEMLGRTSIKVVLPAVWRNQPHIHAHPWFSEYRRDGGDGRPLDPYKVLPPLPLGEAPDEEEVVNDGTGAIRIYEELIFRRDVPPEFTANRRRLLEQYCKLDTAAMIMIWKHWCS